MEEAVRAEPVQGDGGPSGDLADRDPVAARGQIGPVGSAQRRSASAGSAAADTDHGPAARQALVQGPDARAAQQ